MKIEQIELEKLIPYVNNSRTHSDEQVAQIAGSIKEFGFNNPVLIDADGNIIAGHGRVMAARRLQLEKVPCIRLGHLTEIQKKAYVIADNKLALNAGWDENLLRIELQDLLSHNFDLDVVGFSDTEIKNLLDFDTEVLGEDPPNDESRNLLLVDCQGERELEKLFEELQERGFEVKIMQ